MIVNYDILIRHGEGVCVSAADCTAGQGTSVGTCANCNGCATCCKVSRNSRRFLIVLGIRIRIPNTDPDPDPNSKE